MYNSNIYSERFRPFRKFVFKFDYYDASSDSKFRVRVACHN